MPKQHQARLADPSKFGHFDTNTNEGGAGVDFQYGVMADGSRTLQAIHFDAENITAEAAQAWLKKRNLTAIAFVADVGDDVQAESVLTGDDCKAGQTPVAEPEIVAFDPNQDRDDGGRFAGSKAASRKAEEASEQAAGGTGTHKDAQHAHYAAQASHLAESKRRAAEGDLGGAAKSKTMAAYHADQAETHRKESWKHEGNALGGRLSLGKAASAAGAGALIGLAIRTIAGKAPAQPGDIQAFNPNHEPGSGRFSHGSGGTKKLHDAGANAASDVAHAASKSAAAFTGSHASAAAAHREAAAVAFKVHQRSAKEYEAALQRKDSIGAMAHLTESTGAYSNAQLHQKQAMEHDNRAQAEAEHAIRTGLAGKLPEKSQPQQAKGKGPSLTGRIVVGLAKGTWAVAKSPFQLAGWAIGKAEAGRKARNEQRAKAHAAEAAKQAGEAADAVDRATGAAKSSAPGLPPPRPRNPDAFTVDEHGNVRRPGAMPLGLPAPSSSDGRGAIQDAVWEFKDKIDRHNAAAASTPGVPPLPGGSSSNPQGRSSPGDVQSPRFDPKQAADANEEALNRLRRKAAENSPTSGSGLSRAKGKVRPYRPWEVAEAEQPVASVAAAILAVRRQSERDALAPIVGAAAPEGEFPSIHADAGVVITAGQSAPGRKPRFVIRPAYNGGPIQVSAYRLPIIVNLAGMSINAQSVAANLHHDTTKIVGHADDVQNDGKKLNLAGPISGAGAAADEFRNSHANGFPWKASIEARPLKKPELVPAGKSVEVNGRSFSGPVLVAWETELYGVAFVPRGADDKTSVDIAARAAHDTIIRSKDIPMEELTFAEWLDALGLVEAELKPGQVETMKAKHKEAMAAIKAASAAAGGGSGDGGEGGGTATLTAAADFDLDDIRAEAETHTEELEIVYAKYEDEEGLPKKDLRKIQASAKQELRALKQRAIQSRWSPAIFAAELRAARSGVDLALLRAARPTGVTIVSGRPNPEVTGDILAAALLQAGKYHQKRFELTEEGKERHVSIEKIEDVFAEETLDAADKMFHGGIGLQELLLEAAQANGYRGRKFPKQFYGEVLQAAFCQGPYMPIHAAGESSTDLGGILSNYLNKFLLQGFYQVEQVWRQICSIKRVEDFKLNYSYRMNADSMFQPLAPGGEIKRGVLSDEVFTNKANTYAKGFSVTRETIINDDLSAMIQVPVQIGRGSGLQINDMFWRAFLATAAFWQSTGNAVTYQEGANTALGIDSMSLAETLFLNMRDANDNPIGHQPEKLLVPVALGPLAASLFNSSEIRDTTASKQYPTNNPHTGKYRPVVSRYLSNAKYPGYSSKAWYLLGDQNVVSVIEVCFLFGQEAPVIETSQANFNTLGIDMRGFHDAGVNRQDHRGGVKSKGEA